MHWIINDNIEFRPGSKKLISANNPEVSVTLTSPASRCLLLLLEASPNVVLQQDFFKKVWEEEGMLVPANTLYQNISIVRRGLRAVGETDRRLIATIPRKGFQIDASVKVYRQAEVMSEFVPDTANTTNNEIPTNETLPHSTPLLLAGVPSINIKKPSPKRLHWKAFAIVMLISFIMGMLTTLLFQHISGAPVLFQSYRWIEKEKGCNFYANNDAYDGDNNDGHISNIIKSTGLDCRTHPWIYAYLSRTSPTLTAFLCKNELSPSTSPECTSLFFRGVNDD
ncbi:transcriptional regulator [Kosakonia sp.]|uniref:winged helix-turn-helix domain-containing protein n=1 Tax=Kosakonia sp. TaxID=1916651 RepID=UPI00289CB290|nr:transcriptional regulator [Kosakonia sp.]